MDDSYSVVIPVFNGARFIEAAIDSILHQQPGAHRIIVVDDGSTDETATTVRGRPVQLLSQENKGPGAATTAGLAAVDTPFTAFLDADDLWLDGKAKLQLQRLRDNPHIDGVFARGIVSRTMSAPYSHSPTQPIWGRPSLMVRTDRARQVGPMIDLPGRRGEMIDWIKRAQELGLHFEMMDQVLVVRRIHEDSLTFRRGVGDVGYLAVAKAALDRRRAAKP